MDSTNATSEDDLRIDWGAPDEVGAPVPEPALSLPPDLFAASPPDPVEEAPAALPVEEEASFVLDELFGEDPDEDGAPAAAGTRAPVVVGDLFSTATAVKTKPRLAPERTGVPTSGRRWNLGNRKLWISGAVVAAVVALGTLVNQPADPSVNVRSAAPADSAPSVTASTRPLPSTTAPPSSSTTVATTPSTSTAAEAGAAVTTASPATTAATSAAAPRATVGPAPVTTPVTTAAPAPPDPPTSTATTEPDPVTTEPPPPDTTVTTRRPRETVPPPTTPSTTSTTVERDEVVEVD